MTMQPEEPQPGDGKKWYGVVMPEKHLILLRQTLEITLLARHAEKGTPRYIAREEVLAYLQRAEPLDMEMPDPVKPVSPAVQAMMDQAAKQVMQTIENEAVETILRYTPEGHTAEAVRKAEEEMWPAVKATMKAIQQAEAKAAAAEKETHLLRMSELPPIRLCHHCNTQPRLDVDPTKPPDPKGHVARVICLTCNRNAGEQSTAVRDSLYGAAATAIERWNKEQIELDNQIPF